MPKLTSQELDTHAIKGTSFNYSAAKIDDLGATEYTLVTIVVDRSGSVSGFKTDLEKCLGEIVKSCKYSARADNLMIRLITFADDLNEEHGFKELGVINPDDYIDAVNTGGMTALYDACVNSIGALSDYAKKLTEQDFDVNGIIFVLTDGADNRSTYNPQKVAEVLKDAVKSESIESLVSVLVGVNVDEDDVKQYLKDFKDNAGFTQYQEIDKADSKTLAKLAEFVSKSISLQSKSLNSGGTSNQLSLTI